MTDTDLLQQRMDIPKRYRLAPDLKFKCLQGIDGHIEKATEAIKRGDSLFIHGTCGTGKTLLSTRLMNYWFYTVLPKEAREDNTIRETAKLPKFINMPKLLLDIKGSWDAKDDLQAESEKQIISNHTRYPFLVLDDLGQGNWTDWTRGVVYNIINERYNEERPTIITSNMTLDHIADVAGDCIASRLNGMGEVIKLDGKDWRVKAGH